MRALSLKLLVTIAALLTIIAFTHTASALIPRRELFSGQDRAMPILSPDGKKLAYLAPLNGAFTLHVADINDPTNGKPVMKDRISHEYFWGYDNVHIFYSLSDKKNKNTHVYKVNVNTLETQDITPFEKVSASVIKQSKKFPDKLLISMNKETPKRSDLYELDINSGALRMVYRNEKTFPEVIFDEEYRLRFALKENDDYSKTIFEVDEKLNLKPFMEIGSDDRKITGVLALSREGNTLYVLDSRNKNTSALFSYNLKNGTRTLLFHDPKADISAVLLHPISKAPQAVWINYLKTKLYVLDPEIKPDIKFLSSYHKEAQMSVINQDLENNLWVIEYMFDDKPTRYYLYTRNSQDMQFLFSASSRLTQYQLSKMRPFIIKARDGLKLVSYLTLPVAVEPKENNSLTPNHPVPLILDVHGGPESHNNWGFNALTQFFANRGYAVLSVNYRGSIGFGKSFTQAGHGEYAGKMQNDLIDAVEWAIKNKITTKDQICIYGHSYGGYAALVGLTFTPNLFACGIDISGPSNLVDLIKSAPSSWAPSYKHRLRRFGGDPDTEDGRKFLLARSPVKFARNIKKPLLIIQGGIDTIVRRAQSDQMVAEMKTANIPVTYLVYPDEGHMFMRNVNRISIYAAIENFLAKTLGGQAELINNAFSHSSVKVVEGDSWLKSNEAKLR